MNRREFALTFFTGVLGGSTALGLDGLLSRPQSDKITDGPPKLFKRSAKPEEMVFVVTHQDYHRFLHKQIGPTVDYFFTNGHESEKREIEKQLSKRADSTSPYDVVLSDIKRGMMITYRRNVDRIPGKAKLDIIYVGIMSTDHVLRKESDPIEYEHFRWTLTFETDELARVQRAFYKTVLGEKSRFKPVRVEFGKRTSNIGYTDYGWSPSDLDRNTGIRLPRSRYAMQTFYENLLSAMEHAHQRKRNSQH